MGVMRFLIDPLPSGGDWPEAWRSYISGFDGRVFPTRVEFEGNMMLCRRQSPDSGRLHVAWPVAGRGRPLLFTTSLREQEAPYILAVELARGKLSQVRDQLGSWQLAGMPVPDDFYKPFRAAHRALAKAVAAQDRPAEAGELAEQALEESLRAADFLVQTYTRLRLTVRRRKSPQLPASLGCHLGQITPDRPEMKGFGNIFNSAQATVSWKLIEPVEGTYNWELPDAQLEFIRENKLLASAGPLLDFAAGGLPEWLSRWDQDLLNLQSFVSDFIETAISRYEGRIRRWEIAAYPNTGGALALNEEKRLRLVARMLEVARQADQDLQMMIRVAQPWGEYQARGQHQLSPLQFVDALLRSGSGLSEVTLEIAAGFQPLGTAPRDLLDLSQLIDSWTSLGVPLNVVMAVPAETAPLDPLAAEDLEVDSAGKSQFWTPARQAEWIERTLPVLLSKQSVVSTSWLHYSDAVPHRFPHAGLISADGIPRPGLAVFSSFRQDYWESASEADTVV